MIKIILDTQVSGQEYNDGIILYFETDAEYLKFLKINGKNLKMRSEISDYDVIYTGELIDV
jgi:hypothetical protein